MKIGDKITREIYPGNIAEITVTSVDADGYHYAIEFQDGRKGSGFRSRAEEEKTKAD